MPEDPPRAILTSLHAIKHGGRSGQLLLPHEDEGAWIEMRDMYREEFDPQTVFLKKFVDAAAQANWILQRNQTNLHTVLVELPEDPRLWTEPDHHQIALFTRYQTAAERTFSLALARLQSYHKLQRKSEEVKTLTAPKPPKKEAPKEPVILEQWVEVQAIDGEVVTQFYPTNEELEQMIKDEEPKPTMVYRRLSFPDGVPAQYQWTTPRTGHATNGGMAIQRMTVETWLSMRAKERKSGHAESTDRPSLPDWRDQEPES